MNQVEYLVKALDTYEKYQITDNELGYIPKAGKQFKVDKCRLEVLLGKNRHNKVFVKLIEEIKEIKQEQKQKKVNKHGHNNKSIN